MVSLQSLVRGKLKRLPRAGQRLCPDLHKQTHGKLHHAIGVDGEVVAAAIAFEAGQIGDVLGLMLDGQKNVLTLALLQSPCERGNSLILLLSLLLPGTSGVP